MEPNEEKCVSRPVYKGETVIFHHHKAHSVEYDAAMETVLMECVASPCPIPLENEYLHTTADVPDKGLHAKATLEENKTTGHIICNSGGAFENPKNHPTTEPDKFPIHKVIAVNSNS